MNKKINKSGQSITGASSPYKISHDKNKMRITIDYSPTIIDLRRIVSEQYNTCFDADVGAICQFIKEQLNEYAKKDETEKDKKNV